MKKLFEAFLQRLDEIPDIDQPLPSIDDTPDKQIQELKQQVEVLDNLLVKYFISSKKRFININQKKRFQQEEKRLEMLQQMIEKDMKKPNNTLAWVQKIKDLVSHPRVDLTSKQSNAQSMIKELLEELNIQVWTVFFFKKNVSKIMMKHNRQATWNQF